MANPLIQQTSTGEIYELPVDYDDPQWRTIDPDRYFCVGHVWLSDYPVIETGIKLVRFRELAFDHDPNDQDIIDQMEALNCIQPNRAEVETVIRKKYSPAELKQHPRIGLIGPRLFWTGVLTRAYVDGTEEGLYLDRGWVEDCWVRDCRVVVVCK